MTLWTIFIMLSTMAYQSWADWYAQAQYTILQKEDK